MIARICSIALLAAVLGSLLSEYGFKGKKLFSVTACVVLLTLGCGLLGEAFGKINGFGALAGIGEAAGVAVKIVGAGYVFGISSDVCRELGEGGVANVLTLVGRLEIFVIVLPYITKILELGVELIK